MKNWFEKMPLHFRYLWYLFGGILIGIELMLIFLY